MSEIVRKKIEIKRYIKLNATINATAKCEILLVCVESNKTCCSTFNAFDLSAPLFR